jgi:excisionase family DNA binding protein
MEFIARIGAVPVGARRRDDAARTTGDGGAARGSVVRHRDSSIAFLVDNARLGRMGSGHDLLTTGQAALLLGCSRQHVVDLCERGNLASLTVGTHRRVRRADIERLAFRDTRPEVSARASRPEELRSLWLHRAVAGVLARDPEGVLGRARRNLVRLERVHPAGMSAQWLARWRILVEEGPEAVMRALVAESGDAVELRQNSPFAGVLSQAERLAILRAFRRYAGVPPEKGGPSLL